MGSVAFSSGIGEQVFIQLCRLPRLHFLSITDHGYVSSTPSPSFLAPITHTEVVGPHDLVTGFVQSLLVAQSTSSIQSLKLRYVGGSIELGELSELTKQICNCYTGTLSHFTIQSDEIHIADFADSNDTDTVTGIDLLTATAAIVAPLLKLSHLKGLKIDFPFASYPFDIAFSLQISNYWPNLTELDINNHNVPDKLCDLDLLSMVVLAVALPQLVLLNVPFVSGSSRLPTTPPGQNLSLECLGNAQGGLGGNHEISRIAEFIYRAFPGLITIRWQDGQWSPVYRLVVKKQGKRGKFHPNA
ncbi:hypothetical protein DXG01_008327 [Tephrocybe rancida]|nr:hypothetical protein DXG01_008327 [Tephrocybe rancida]